MDVIVEFRAGLSHFTDGSVTPDPRKGMFRVVNIDGLTHLQWLVRERQQAIEPPEVDLVIFPEEANFIQKDVPPGARYMQLMFQDTTRQDLFFWMQEPDAQQDAVLCQTVQQAINMGDVGGVSESNVNSAADEEGGEEAASSGLLGADFDLASILRGGLAAQGNAPPAPQQAPPTGGGVAPGLTPEYLASILSGMAGEAQRGPRQQFPSLSEVVTPQNLVPLLEDERVKKRLGELVEYLPKEHQEKASKDAYSATVEALRCAPLRNQLRTLAHALATGQLDFTQLGLDPLGYSTADFLESMQKSADKSKQKQ